MGRLFGTDGVRGIANKELTCEIAMQLGRAIAMVIGKGRHNKYKLCLAGALLFLILFVFHQLITAL